MLNLKRWYPAVYEDGAFMIEMELKRLRFDEVSPVLGVFGNAQGALADVSDQSSVREKGMALFRFCEQLPTKRIEAIFSDCVRNVKVTHKGEEVSLDGEPITTGAQLYEVADPACVVFLLTQLQDGAGLTVTEGKVSDSPALSPETAGLESSASPAASIGQEAGAGL